MTIPDDESTPRPAGSGEPTTPPPAAGPTPPAENQGFPAAPPPPPAAYPASNGSTAGAPVTAPTAPPRTVNIAFWLYVAGAVLSVISGIITVATIGGQRDQFLRSVQDTNQTNGQNAQAVVDAVIAGATVWAIITLIFWAVTFVLFAFFMRRGANWARIILTVLTALSLLNILAGYGVGFIQFAATVVALVLMWLRPSNEYFSAVKATKVPRT